MSRCSAGSTVFEPLASRGDQPVMPVVAVVQHAGAALGGIDKEQERQAEQAEALGGLLDGKCMGPAGS